MISINNQTLVNVDDIVVSGAATKSYIHKAVSIGTTGYNNPIKQKGKLYFLINQLPERVQIKIENYFGDPIEYLKREPIKALIKKDLEAERYFLNERKLGLYSFSDDWIHEKVTAASWLNMLVRYWNKEVIRELFDMSIDTFIKNVIDIIKALNIGLPTSYKRLKKKVDTYELEGYKIFIHGLTGQPGNAAKISNEESEAVLLGLLENPNQYDDVTVCLSYNFWAKQNGFEEIGVGAVGVWRRKKAPEITIGRYGNGRLVERHIRQVKGFKPTCPGYLWESDDNNLDKYFKGEDNPYSRYVSYIVADSYCGLILGKSYRVAKSPCFEMVKLAYIDAMYYVRSLTGQWHLPFELKADHWQKTNAFPYFERIANFVPPAHANKHRGYIEPLFGSPHFKRCHKLGTTNYNGNNITAKNTGVNTERLFHNQNNWPTVGEEAELQLEQFFYRLRKLPDVTRNNMNAASKEEQWLAKWNTLSPDQKRPISDEQFLLIFGITHAPQGRTITITNRGIEPQINGIKYSYDLPDYVNMMELIGEQVSVVYDPYDMSRVLITNGEIIRFVAQSAQLLPRALKDTYANSRHMLNLVLSEKKEQVAKVSAKAEKRRNLLSQQTDPELIVLGQFMPKELKNNVEDHYLPQTVNETFEAERMAYLDSQIDFSQDFD